MLRFVRLRGLLGALRADQGGGLLVGQLGGAALGLIAGGRGFLDGCGVLVGARDDDGIPGVCEIGERGVSLGIDRSGRGRFLRELPLEVG